MIIRHSDPPVVDVVEISPPFPVHDAGEAPILIPLQIHNVCQLIDSDVRMNEKSMYFQQLNFQQQHLTLPHIAMNKSCSQVNSNY